MLQYFNTKEGKINKLPDYERNCWVSVVDPSEEDLVYLQTEFPIAEDYINYPLDMDEKARIERDDDAFFMLVRMPHFVGLKEEIPFTTIPVGLIVTKENIISICKEDNVIIDEFENGRIKDINPAKRYKFLLQILLKAAGKYLTHLREINKIVDSLEDKLQASMRNKELQELLKYQKILVYYTTALKSNEVMLERLQRSGLFQNYSDDAEMLDDVIIEFQQAIEMTSISNNILTQMMGAYASIINNNMNIVIKFLTIITITISIPTLIASLYGMNIKIPAQDNPHMFSYILLTCFVLCSGVIFFFMKRKWF
jgi:magnesium transporter